MVGDTICRHEVAAAGAEEGADVGKIEKLKATPLAGHHPDENPGRRSRQRARIDPGIFERAPRRLQQQPLLRVECRRLDGRYTEEVVVECIHLVDEVAASGVHRSGRAVGLVEGVDIPSLSGHFGVGDDTVHHQPPERVLVRRTREAAVNADNGDGYHDEGSSVTR